MLIRISGRIFAAHSERKYCLFFGRGSSSIRCFFIYLIFHSFRYVCFIIENGTRNVYLQSMGSLSPRFSGRTLTRRRRCRLVRSERVFESSTPHVTAWDIIVRDSLLQIAWPMSLTADEHMSSDFSLLRFR